jgi:hypothetical protein
MFEIVSFRLWRLGIRTGSGVRSKTKSNSLEMLTKSQSDVEWTGSEARSKTKSNSLEMLMKSQNDAEFKLPERIKPEVNSSLQ